MKNPPCLRTLLIGLMHPQSNWKFMSIFSILLITNKFNLYPTTLNDLTISFPQYLVLQISNHIFLLGWTWGKYCTSYSIRAFSPQGDLARIGSDVRNEEGGVASSGAVGVSLLTHSGSLLLYRLSNTLWPPIFHSTKWIMIWLPCEPRPSACYSGFRASWIWLSAISCLCYFWILPAT